MTPAKPIPAPWTANLEDAPQDCEIEILHRGTPIAYVRNVDDMEDIGDADPDQLDAEARATALLIAAAPDLFEACTTAFEAWQKGDASILLSKCWDQIRAALEKARGEKL
jgi:hypothetical protein